MKILIGHWSDPVSRRDVIAWDANEGANRYIAECYKSGVLVDTMSAGSKKAIQALSTAWVMEN